MNSGKITFTVKDGKITSVEVQEDGKPSLESTVWRTIWDWLQELRDFTIIGGR